MAEQIQKLTPDRDLQCYFLTPSAIAAMSQANDSGFVVSGKWRQQFDWAVVEWNRDNVFEHPVLRNLPDGDLSELTLSYQEQRTGCIPIESNLYPFVSWNKIRVWVPNGDGTETIYYIDVAMYATANGDYQPASATMTLIAPPDSNGWVGLAWLDEHYWYQPPSGQDLSDIAAGLAAIINDPNVGSPTFSATSNGPSVTVTWNPTSPQAPYQDLFGANGNRIGMYGFAHDNVNVWQEPSAVFAGGEFPGTNGFPGSYTVSLNFANIQGTLDPTIDPKDPDNAQYVVSVPMNNVRKLRWTWAADLQSPDQLIANNGAFQQTEFEVVLSDWTVTGANRLYSVAGPGSRRIEDTDSAVTYSGAWNLDTGNYSGSKIHWTQETGDSCTINYSETAQHQLYLGTRLIATGASINVSIDNQPAQTFSLQLSGEDVLIRLPLGSVNAGSHSVVVTHAGPASSSFYFDFLEIAYPSTNLPDFAPQTELALATDWDTYHSQSLPAERTAWLINKLGFQGRANHYTGALWFYEIVRTGTQYASASVNLTIVQPPNSTLAELQIGDTTIQHLILPDDTSETLAQAFALLINAGSNSVWVTVNGTALTITARAMGVSGNSITVSVPSTSQGYNMDPVSVTLSGGIDGAPYDLDPTDPLNSALMAEADFWRTDLSNPQLNRAAHDWHLAYFTALKGYGIDAVASFSTELMNGDPSEATGIAQRYPDGTPAVLNTPSIQTNFSPTTLAFWSPVYLEMASLQDQAGLTPYLQFGEVQWWYFPKPNVGMSFYDDYTVQQFQEKYGTPMQTIISNTADPSQYPNETAFLPSLIGAYTSTIRSAVQAQIPNCRFEVLYPADTNNTALNQLVNYPDSDWTPANLNCLKTEDFTYTGNHNLDLSSYAMNVSASKGFPNTQRSHLVGIGDSWTAWMKEVDLAQSQQLESVVLFALDQYCLIGYGAPPFVKLVRSQRQG